MMESILVVLNHQLNTTSSQLENSFTVKLIYIRFAFEHVSRAHDLKVDVKKTQPTVEGTIS